MVEEKAKGKIDLTSEMYKAILERGEEGVLQSDLWKELGLTSRDGSRIALRLERRKLIKRERVLKNGRWTYRLTPIRFPVDFSSIEGVPCITCPYENQCMPDGIISPTNCPLERYGRGLADWVLEGYKKRRKR
ncbi:MAG: transcriptional regulator [Thaumarchaeota archaeon]|nr:transcriptional regulator [Nitrososphaerota archaeon]